MVAGAEGLDRGRLALAVGLALAALVVVLAAMPDSRREPAPEAETAVAITISPSALKAAEDGDTDAQYAVANSMLADPDLSLAYSAKALEFLQHAADKGHKRAMLRLGQLYRKGVGALQNYTLAAKWIEAAAKLGEPEAMLEFGRLYREGVGVPRDPVLAYVWMNRAAAARNLDAARERDEVVRILTAEELRQAQERSVVPESPPAASGLKPATELAVPR